VKVPIEVLSKYVGTYDGTNETGRKMVFEVTLNGDQLKAAPQDGGGFILVPDSPTTFSASGAPVIFHVGADGVPTDFVVHTVEGDLRFVRRR
jgi:hypothetical protein